MIADREAHIRAIGAQPSAHSCALNGSDARIGVLTPSYDEIPQQEVFGTPIAERIPLNCAAAHVSC